MIDFRQLELWRHARLMRRRSKRQDLASIKSEYRECAWKAQQLGPVGGAISKAEAAVRDLRRRTPDSRYLELLDRDLRQAAGRFGAYESTYDRRRELMELAFSREYPDAGRGSREWKDKYASFFHAWEAENGPERGDKTIREIAEERAAQERGDSSGDT
jgi:hypothetical protein